MTLRAILLSISVMLLGLLSICVAVGKTIKYILVEYTSDLYLAVEMARNVVELRRVFVSTLFGNFIGLHLYWLNILEAIPVTLFSGYYFMVMCGGVLFAATISTYFIAIKYSQSTWFAAFLAGAFALNPMTLSILDMRVYGFQYDIYALAFLPFLVWSVMCASDFWFILVAVATLMVKEEIAISVCLVGLYFVIWRPYRARGGIVLAFGCMYLCAAMFVLKHYALEAYVHPSLNVKSRLIEGGGLWSSLQTFSAISGNFVLDFAKECARLAGPIFYPLLAFSVLPTFPLTIFTAALYHNGFLSFDFLFWKIPYLWSLSWIFLAINIGRLMRRGRWAFRLGLCSSIGLFITSAFVYSQVWQRDQPAYRLSNVWQFVIGNFSNLDLPAMNPLSTYTERKADLQAIEKLRVGKSIALFSHGAFAPLGELNGRVHFKLAPGHNLLLIDRMNSMYNVVPPSVRDFSHLPLIFSSPRFLVFSFSVPKADERSEIEYIQSEIRGDNMFSVKAISDGAYAVEVSYTRDITNAAEYDAYFPITWALDGISQQTPTMHMATIGQTADDAARVVCGYVRLTAGMHLFSFPVMPATKVWQLNLVKFGN